jgi:hypothetical protein
MIRLQGWGGRSERPFRRSGWGSPKVLHRRLGFDAATARPPDSELHGRPTPAGTAAPDPCSNTSEAADLRRYAGVTRVA